MADQTITLTDADAGIDTADPGDKITWHNGTTDKDITINPPSCVSPNQSDTMDPGGDSRQYTVNNSPKADYAYTFSVADTLGLRNGTIRVN